MNDGPEARVRVKRGLVLAQAYILSSDAGDADVERDRDEALQAIEAGLADLDDSDPPFHALRAWRAATARARMVPPYVIATDAVLRAIAEAHPKTIEELGAVRGLGPAKAATYGDEMLDALRQTRGA